MRGSRGSNIHYIAVALLACAVALLSGSSTAQAAVFDPGAGWMTITTPHFRIHHPERISDVAQRAAGILEEIHPKITEKWDWQPWGRSEVVLTDSTDEANGMTSVLPYNWMLIFVSPPDPDSSLGNFDDWLRTLLIHEYTHLVQIDAIGGGMHLPRFILGKTASPSGMNPVWMREGIAQYDETYYTTGGRGRGSYSEMVVRASVLDDAFPSIDVADGLGWRWPGYKTAYIYGIEFVEWLISTYGEERFMKLDRRIRSSLLVGMLNHDARNVYGMTFYELWNEWLQTLEKKYAQVRASVESQGETSPSEIVVPTGRDGQYAVPALSPDRSKLVYTAASPHGKAEVRLLDMASGETQMLKKGQEPVQYSWSPDGTKIAYSVLGKYKHFYNYYDLWIYDFTKEKKRFKKLTTGERARDPEFDRSGTSILFVGGEKGTDQLKRINVESKEIAVLMQTVLPNTQFANPRLSPDGRFIAVSVWRSGDGWRIYRYAADGSGGTRLTEGKGLVIESRPVWTGDGGHVLYASDEGGISNLYRVGWNGGRSTRLTNVLTGVFQPQIGEGSSVYAQYYTSKGFVIARFDLPQLYSAPEGALPKSKAKGKGKAARGEGEGAAPQTGGIAIGHGGTASSGAVGAPGSAAGSVGTAGETGAAGGAAEAPPYKDEKYVAFGKSLFLPRFIVPYAMYGDGYVFASALTGGTDPLRWHNWVAAATYRSDANMFGYTFFYAYNRFKPVFGATASLFAVDYGNIAFDTDGDVTTTNDQVIVHYFEKRHRISPYMAIPFKNNLFSLSYFYEDHQSLTKLTPAENAALNLGKFAGFMLEYRYGDAEKFPASISRENGRNIRLTGSITNKHLGSGDRNEQVIFSGDWREYVKLWHNHVLALRSAGGMTWGDRLVQGTFAVGGALGEGQFASGGSFNYFPLRGLPLSAISCTRAMLISSEYRFPIYSLQRGLGTLPLYLKEVSGAVFADYGDGWTAATRSKSSIKTFFDDFLLGVGAELRGDFVLGHGLPIHGRVGYAIIVLNRDRLDSLTDPILGTSIKDGMLILSIGTIF
ncbi:MAG: hypothetical protein WC956_06690 [bacterium]